MAVKNVEPTIFVEKEISPGHSFSYAEPAQVTCPHVDGNDFGVAGLSSGWAVLFFSGEYIEQDNFQRYVNAFGARTSCVILNASTSVMCSDFSLFVDSTLRCSVVHNGYEDNVLHLEKTGRLPNGGRQIVDQAFKLQKNVTDVDHVYSIPENLAELVTGFSAVGAESNAKPINGFRLLK